MTRPKQDDARLEAEISAYVDGELGPDEASAIETLLAADPAAFDRFAAYSGHKRLIAEAADALAAEAGPAVNLRTRALERELAAALSAAHRPAPAASAWRRAPWPAQMAAAAAVAAFGWFGHAAFVGVEPPLPGYVSEAVGAHRVFGEDARHPVEFAAATDAEALRWMGDKLGSPLAVPALDPLGLAYLGARLHGTREGPIVQFVYEDAEGERLSLMLARHPEGAPALDLTLADHGDGHVGYWSDRQLDYAVVSHADAPRVRAYAEEFAAAAF